MLCPLKTASSKRVLALDATTVGVLRRYRQEQESWYRAHGRRPSGYVFTALDGGPLSPDYLASAAGRGKVAPAQAARPAARA
ncbi:MAG: hypothetical protein ACRDN0_19640 [Trebonia sp.]